MMSDETVNNNAEDKNENQVDVSALKAELDDLKNQFNAVNNKKNELLDEAKKAKARAKEEAEAKERAKLEKAQKEGDFEQLLKSSEKEREALSHELDTLRNKVSSEKMRNESMRIASELADGTNAELLSEFVAKRLKYTDDGLKVLDSDGNLTVSSLSDLKNEFENSDKYQSLIRGSKSSGGSAGGDGGSAPGSITIKRAEFNKMSHSQRATHFSNGGKVID